MRRYHFELESQPFSASTIRQYDCVLIGTDHDVFDYEVVFNEAQLVVDTRGRASKRNNRVFRA
jgi:UDP-N-acetyl-D-glucosamine dehydrogenase